jgi:hypothetical protein
VRIAMTRNSLIYYSYLYNDISFLADVLIPIYKRKRIISSFNLNFSHTPLYYCMDDKRHDNTILPRWDADGDHIHTIFDLVLPMDDSHVVDVNTMAVLSYTGSYGIGSTITLEKKQT